MMAMISPALEAIQESLSTLKFANRAKNIKNEAKINEDLDQKSLLRKYERELKRLRAELEERSRNVVDKRRLLELDEQRRRAEADKMTAIRCEAARLRSGNSRFAYNLQTYFRSCNWLRLFGACAFGRALEARSLEFMQEKEEKKKLEDKILALTSQVRIFLFVGQDPKTFILGLHAISLGLTMMHANCS
jgi:kinesin family protein 3/17